MSNIMRHIESKHLLAFWVTCLVIFGIYSPPVLTSFNVYMGMLLGYLQAKTQFLLLFGSNVGELIVGSYLSLRYKFGLSSTSHDGINILLANTLYFAITTTALYILLKRYGKVSMSKTVVISAITSGILMIVVGITVLTSNPKVLSQVLSNEPYAEYVVQVGDTCEKIAFDYSVSVESIVRSNKLPNTCLLMVGQSIEIPLH